MSRPGPRPGQMATLLVLGLTLPLALPATELEELFGLWRSGDSVIEIGRRQEDESATWGRLVAVSEAALARGFTYDDVILTELAVRDQGAIRFKISVRADDPELRDRCQPAEVAFIGEIRRQANRLDGERELVEFSIADDGSCVARHTSSWVEKIYDRVQDAPACCAALSYGCQDLQLRDLGLGAVELSERDWERWRLQCREQEQEARHRCQARVAFRESFAERQAAGDAGQSKLRVLEVFEAASSIAIAREAVPEGWRYLASSRQQRVGESMVWDFSQATSLDDNHFRALVVLALGDGHFDNVVARVWRTREELARIYLDDKLDRMINQCQHSALVGGNDIVAMSMLAGYFESSGPPELRQGWTDLRADAATLTSDNASGLERAVAGLSMAAVPIATLLGVRGGLRHAVADLGGQSRRRLQAVEHQVEELVALRDRVPRHRRSQVNELLSDARQRAEAEREILQGLQDAEEFILDNGELVFRQRMLDGHSRQELLESLRSTTPGSPAYNLVAEALGEGSLQRYYRQRGEVPGFWRPHRPHRHGPDQGFRETIDELRFPGHGFRDGEIDVLVEAKTRRNITAATRPDNNRVLGRLASRARQHSPNHIRDFAGRRTRSAQRRIDYLERARSEAGRSAEELQAIDRSLAEWRQHQAYWRNVGERAHSGYNLRLEVVMTNAETGASYRWRWDYNRQDWILLGSHD